MGSSGLVPLQPEQISVPADSDPSRTSGCTCSWTQRHVDLGSGAAVERIDFNPVRSQRLAGNSPERSTIVRYGAPTAKRVVCVLAMISKCRSAAFTFGEPP